MDTPSLVRELQQRIDFLRDKTADDLARVLSGLRAAARDLSNLAAAAQRSAHTGLMVDRFGTVHVQVEPEPALSLGADGSLELSLMAGERLGTILQRKREALNISTKDVAEKLPIREEAYKRVESGYTRRPPNDILEAIATALGLDAADLKTAADKDRDEPVDYVY